MLEEIIPVEACTITKTGKVGAIMSLADGERK